MDTVVMPRAVGQAPVFFFQHDSNKHQYQLQHQLQHQQHQHQHQMAMHPGTMRPLPSTPMYSRPGSSCSQHHRPTLFSNGPSVITPSGSPAPAQHRPAAMMLDTEFADSPYLPSTPPLSASGSTIGSPKGSDVLQTPMNPMFSGLDCGVSAVKTGLECADMSALEWSSCGSPQMMPVYIQSQPANVLSLSSISSASDLSATSSPSLSPSPTPYARSIASEHDVDFCDPRNLTVSGAGASNPTLAPEFTPTGLGLGDDEARTDPAALSQPAFDFNLAVPHGLPAFEDLSDLDSDDDFGNLVNLGERDSADVSRPRACSGSSVVSLGHGSFIGDDDLDFDESETFHFPSLPSPPSSIDSCDDGPDNKRQKTDGRVEPVMNTAASDTPSGNSQQHSDKAGSVASDVSASSNSDDVPPAPAPATTNRRGRKQSLTEDPSKTFVCDLCNRRFRRQEHLKRHYRSLHTQEKPFECHECGKKFSRSDNLAQHARTHAGGAIIMNLIENGEASAYDSGMVSASANDEYANYGKVLFQITSEVPGSASDLSSDEGSDQGKKKRKRSD